MRCIVDEPDQVSAHGIVPRHVPGFFHFLNQVGHDLVVWRHRLRAAFIVKFAAVVVWRIVRCGNIEATIEAQITNQVRQFWSGLKVLAFPRQNPSRNAIGGIDFRSQFGKRPAGNAHGRVGQVGAVLVAGIVETANIVRQSNLKGFARKPLAKIFAVALNRGA